MSETQDKVLTKIQVEKLCGDVYPLMNATLDLLDPAVQLDVPFLKTLLEYAASHISGHLQWDHLTHRGDTGISRESMIQVMLQATAKVGALSKLIVHPKMIYLQDDDEVPNGWRWMAETLLDIRGLLATSTFQGVESLDPDMVVPPTSGYC